MPSGSRPHRHDARLIDRGDRLGLVGEPARLGSSVGQDARLDHLEGDGPLE